MPLLSVVIPTRNRLYYLRDSLQSALDQACDDLEIIVADNATHDGTQEYLASLGSAIKVTRSETSLSMTDNWHRGLELVTGEWVIVIGDDDCLMPDFVSEAKKTIAAHPGFDLIEWDLPIYRWPESINEHERNMLAFTMRTNTKVLSSETALRNIFHESLGIMSPPGLYHHLSKASLMSRARERYGDYHLGAVPDHGSGMLYLSLTKEYVVIQRPLSVMAFGAQSLGMSFKAGTRESPTRIEFTKLSRLNELRERYPLTDTDNGDVVNWRLILHWRDYFASKGLSFEANDSKLFQYCIARLYTVAEAERQEIGNKYVEFGVRHGNSRESMIAAVNKGLANRYMSPGIGVVPDGDAAVIKVNIDLSKTPVKTATGAAGLIHGFLRR